MVLLGCSSKSYHEEMLENTKGSLDKKDYKNIKETYASSLVDEKQVNKEFISILEDKSLGDILKEMEIIDGNLYYLVSPEKPVFCVGSQPNNFSQAESNRF